MYGRVRRTLPHEIFAFTLCMWIKAGVGPGVGTPFSYSAPGQANELVLIEWGSNPMELLVNDKVRKSTRWLHKRHRSFSVSNPPAPPPQPGCDAALVSERREVAPRLRDLVHPGRTVGGVPGRGAEGLWEQPGPLAPRQAWRGLHPGPGAGKCGPSNHRLEASARESTLTRLRSCLPQDTLGGRFDASQAFVGEMSDLHLWSHVLTASDVYSLASCGSHLRGDVIAWSEEEVELHGGVSSYPSEPCH